MWDVFSYLKVNGWANKCILGLTGFTYIQWVSGKGLAGTCSHPLKNKNRL